jgi:hypothetical protein
LIPQSSQDFIKQLDNPWLRNQVETHLFFGNYKWKYVYLICISLYIHLFFTIFAPSNELYSLDFLKERGSGFVIVLLLSIIFYKYEVSAFFWAVIKILLLFVFFALFLGGIINTLAGERHAYLLSVLGTVWLPSLEFYRRITPYQKFITLFRVMITIPITSIL